jgi:hypothetical protein
LFLLSALSLIYANLIFVHSDIFALESLLGGSIVNITSLFEEILKAEAWFTVEAILFRVDYLFYLVSHRKSLISACKIVQ